MSIGKYDSTNLAQIEKYDTYLSIMLMAFDGLVSVEPDEWDVTIRYQVSLHKEYMKTTLHKSLPPEKSFRKGYHPVLLEAIDKAFEEDTSTAEPSSP